MRRSTLALALAALALAPRDGSAEEATRPGSGADVADRARALFERGVELFAVREYEAALDAFQQSYDLVPVGSVLFNVGMSQMALQRYTESIETLQRYLAEGAAVDVESRREAEAAIAEMASRLGEVRIRVETPGVEVVLDDSRLSTEEMSSLRVRAGRHSLRVTAPRYIEETRQIDVASGGLTVVNISLQPDPAFREEVPLVRRWWFWTVIGVVAAGAATGLAVGLTRGEDLGPGDWDVRLP
jgi:head-tail adaptor